MKEEFVDDAVDNIVVIISLIELSIIRCECVAGSLEKDFQLASALNGNRGNQARAEQSKQSHYLLASNVP